MQFRYVVEIYIVDRFSIWACRRYSVICNKDGPGRIEKIPIIASITGNIDKCVVSEFEQHRIFESVSDTRTEKKDKFIGVKNRGIDKKNGCIMQTRRV